MAKHISATTPATPNAKAKVSYISSDLLPSSLVRKSWLAEIQIRDPLDTLARAGLTFPLH